MIMKRLDIGIRPPTLFRQCLVALLEDPLGPSHSFALISKEIFLIDITYGPVVNQAYF